MKDVMQTRIASVLTAVLGLWLLLSPTFITTTGGALASTLVAGSVLTLAGIVELFWKNTVPSWISGLTAAWLLVSTSVFGMADALFWDTIAAAAIAFMAAIWDGIEISKVAQRHHIHT